MHDTRARAPVARAPRTLLSRRAFLLDSRAVPHGMQVSLDERERPGGDALRARGQKRVGDGERMPARADCFADLSSYSFKQRLIIHTADLAFYALINFVGRTTRFSVEGWQHWEAATEGGRPPIYTSWHNSVFLATYFWRGRGIAVMTSRSFDGEYIARFIQRFGYGAPRGSSSRGAVGALVEMVKLVRQGRPAGFTIDGPRGPRHVAKMGAVLLAKKTGAPVLPFSVNPERYYAAPSWDGLQIPYPFTRARVLIAPPIYVPSDADEAALAAKRDELQRALDSLDD
ncbi:MAG: lysophospholipid acyltransferase family protein [Acidobacteria bacterium]|nr:lysophospholipid acyltransferase family protein [Acidobacteriota bacterium]